MKKYKVYRLNYIPNVEDATKSFEKEFDNKEDAIKYANRQHQLLTEFDGLKLSATNSCMATYFYHDELRTILVREIIDL